VDFNLAARAIAFICECENERCMQIVRLAMPEYEQVRRNGRHFFVSPGHQVPPDQVVAEANGYTTVRKTAREARLVAEQDPRA
jgi:hypothetical protein